MSREQNGFAGRQREAFEAWQVRADEICQQWMSNPAFLYSGRMVLECGLDFYSSAARTLKATVGDTEHLSRVMKEI